MRNAGTRSWQIATAAVLAFAGAAYAQDRPTDEWLTAPVDRATFAAYSDFFAYESGLAFETRVRDDSTQDGVRERTLTFQSTSGMFVTARLYQPAGVDIASIPAVIFLHGGGVRGKDGNRTIREGRFLARAGISVLGIDMWHFGERNDGAIGSGSERDKHDLLYNNEAAYLEWVQQTVKDVRRSYEFLVQDQGADPDRIGLIGFSRGAVAGMISAAIETRLAAVTLLHGGHFDFFEERHRAAACPANYLGRIESPLFFINSETDQDFLLESAILPMHRIAPSSSEFRWTTAGGHGALDDDDRGALATWLKANLAG